ncbi:hypothetical protein JCM19238_1753 [Vibrio ponticus]|nr:hypothetical protein JCM19238_1753 [Vibrio ponticus]
MVSPKQYDLIVVGATNQTQVEQLLKRHFAHYRQKHCRNAQI